MYCKIIIKKQNNTRKFMPSKEIKLIALDIDGTILDKNFSISEKVKSAIKNAIDKGIYVLLATGRMYSATVPIALELGIKTPLVVYQGSLVQEFYESRDILMHHTVPLKYTMEIIKDLRNYGVQINAYINDNLYAENISPILEEYCSKRNIPVCKLNKFEEIENLEPTKLMGIDYNTNLVDEIRNQLKKKYRGTINVSKSTQYFCEFVNSNCSKANSILFLAEKFGVDKSQIMAIGDQDNDKEMLEIAEIAVAMGNGDEELKKIADFVTDTVENDGAALAIERFAL